ncbi:MAG: hypothetical protein NQ127_02615 [Candidatus Cardinium sp.]|nr:hypothetical protein [Candidatus Cardinium sp.]
MFKSGKGIVTIFTNHTQLDQKVEKKGSYKFNHQLSVSAFLASTSLLASAADDLPVSVSPILNSLLELHAN